MYIVRRKRGAVPITDMVLRKRLLLHNWGGMSSIHLSPITVALALALLSSV